MISHFNNYEEITIRSGRIHPSDNEKLASHYTCDCGSRMRLLGHQYSVNGQKTVLDTYHVKCPTCFSRKRLHFPMELHVVKQALESDLAKLTSLLSKNYNISTSDAS